MPDIAQACKAAERGIRILCDSLTIMGLLSKAGNKYFFTPDTAFFLDSRSPAYMGKALKFLLHHKHLEKLEQLTETVRRGGAAAAMSAMTMLSNTPHGDAYTFKELVAMCRHAGFDGMSLVQLHPMPQSLVVARKA